MDELVYKAICEDRPMRLEAFLKQGGDPDMWIEDAARISAKSFLHVCCEKGRIRCVKVLLEYGAQVDIQGSWGQTPLMLCILTEYFDIAELLLNCKRDIIDQQDTHGNTPLHIAISNDSVEAVELLLKYNADVNIMNSNGITPLMKICGMKEVVNMPTIVKLLMEAGGQIDMADFRSRRTALQLAVLSKNVDTVGILLNAGANPNSTDSGFRTPLTNIILENVRNYDTTKVVHPDVMTIIYMLVQAGTDLNFNKFEQSNPLLMAINFRCAPLVRYFLMNGANQTGPFYRGITPLLHAVVRRDIDSLKELLKWPCDLYATGRAVRQNYDTMLDPFELAVHIGCPEIALLLAEVGYNITRIDYLTNWALNPPSGFADRPDIFEYLREMAMQPKSLFLSTVLCIRRALNGSLENKSYRLPLPRLMIEEIKMKAVLS